MGDLEFLPALGWPLDVVVLGLHLVVTPDSTRKVTMPPTDQASFATIAPAPHEIWAGFRRPTPDWLRRSRLGIFIHWGAYSVPAWAEPSGALGTVSDREWFAHNAYAEWYGNTMRIPGSPTALRHQEVYGDAPYDAFLDQWTARDFDPDAWAELFADAGAGFVVPTTKHHDGIALWDAPGTGTRNTVHRGPHRDLVGEIATAVRAHGMHFGVYYSGGLDWSVTTFGPHTSHDDVSALRPRDAAYNMYAVSHVRDLMERYQPDVLWNDINWPDAGKRTGPWSLHELLSDFYAGNPDGVVNDRWGDTHWDFRTSEYEAGTDLEVGDTWEQCRGIGLSFGYNQVEGTDQYLDGRALARLLGDIVSRGGRLLLNVGPTADGQIVAPQQEALRGLGRWMRVARELLASSVPVAEDVAAASDDPWVRWLETPSHLVALVDHDGPVTLAHRHDAAVAGAAVSGAGATVTGQSEGRVEVTMASPGDGPAVVLLPKRRR
ncbi:MAG TPA: alpha-L-fucosidase [Propionibacteriaceae bacterium]